MSHHSTAILLLLLAFATDPAAAEGVSFQVSFAAGAHAEPVTGRVYVAIAREGRRDPIRQVGETGVPLFGKNVAALTPGTSAVIDGDVFGHPVQSLNDIPAGEYRVQAFVNIYTRFPRADGHTVWLPMDHGEGQNWRRSPGNLFSKPRTVRIDPTTDSEISLICDQRIPPVPFPADTPQVKRFKIPSKILSDFWGQPMELGATVLLPRGYDAHPDTHYPVNYVHGHFSTRAPGGYGRGGSFDRLWDAADTPRFIYVTLQHPTPYYDDSYGVNSQNNGPYGDAIHQELIPEIERRFRAIREPWARQLSGGSTGGWIALALQVFHPAFYGGCWASCPDSPDFRYHQIVNIYGDKNAYWIERDWTRVERPTRRRPDGNIVSMMKDENHFELVCGDRSRSGGQWDIWEATYSPVGPDGYPMRLWDKRTGAIDHEVAAHWRENYDLRHILETRWKELGPQLVGKIHVYVGDMDSYYLNNGVSLLQDFLEKAEPSYGGTFEYERLRPHCWGPGAERLMKLMTEHIEKTAPEGADLKSWRH